VPTVSLNSDISLAMGFHEHTKHSRLSVREVQNLDFENRPFPYKVYRTLQPIKLPTDFPHPTRNAIDCLTKYETSGGTVDLSTITELLYFSAGITKTIKYPSGETCDFRAAACTGARYEIEVYVASGQIQGLGAGVYHFNPKDFSLRRLREGDYRSFLYTAVGENEEILSAPVTFILTAIHWRNAWKYQARAFRHFFWDSGTILSNLCSTGISAGLNAKVLLGFVDDHVNRLLGLNSGEETVVCLVPMYGQSVRPASPERAIPPGIMYEHLPLSKRTVEYPEIGVMYSASSLNSVDEVKSWAATSPPKINLRTITREGMFPLKPLSAYSAKQLGEAIILRGSTRRFSRESIPFSYLSTILQASTRSVPTDFLGPGGSTVIDTYLIVNAVDGIPSGGYYYNREEESLDLHRRGDFRDTAAYLCLDQPLGADGSAVAFLMTDLESVLEAYGNRGYGAAQLEGGIILGKMNLCAFALEIGATGITFYDDAVTEFFSPHASRKSNILSVVLGVPAYGKRPSFHDV
jgi:SagB-type dehydrogenase family enzyme